MKYINYLAIAALLACVHQSHASTSESGKQQKTAMDYIVQASPYSLFASGMVTYREVGKSNILSRKGASLLGTNYAVFTAIFGTARKIIDQYTEILKK